MMAVIFQRGFGNGEDIQNLYCWVEEESNIEMKQFGSANEAYIFSCRKYAKRWAWRYGDDSRQLQFVLPQVEDLRAFRSGGVFINPLMEYLLPVVKRTVRYFSAVAPFCCSFADGVDSLFGILARNPLAAWHVVEWATAGEAERYALREYRVQQLSLSAYMTGPVLVPRELSANVPFYGDPQGLMPQAQAIKEIM